MMKANKNIKNIRRLTTNCFSEANIWYVFHRLQTVRKLFWNNWRSNSVHRDEENLQRNLWWQSTHSVKKAKTRNTSNKHKSWLLTSFLFCRHFYELSLSRILRLLISSEKTAMTVASDQRRWRWIRRGESLHGLHSLWA